MLVPITTSKSTVASVERSWKAIRRTSFLMIARCQMRCRWCMGGGKQKAMFAERANLSAPSATNRSGGRALAASGGVRFAAREWTVTKMDEYIKRKAALALVKPDAPEDEKAAVTIATAKKLVRSIVRRTPAADVAPVVHGRWLCVDTDTEQFFLCNRCKKKEFWESNYCPNCGARMDGDSNAKEN